MQIYPIDPTLPDDVKARLNKKNRLSERFGRSCASRFRNIKEFPRVQYRPFLFRIFLADLITTYAVCTERTTHGVARDFARALTCGESPIALVDYIDPHNKFSKAFIDARVENKHKEHCAREGIDFVEHNRCWNEYWNTARYVVEEDWIEEVNSKGLSIIRSYLLKNLVRETGYPFKSSTYTKSLSMINEWIKEANVPHINEIDFSTPEFSDLEVATIARSGLAWSAPLTKRGIRKKRARALEVTTKKTKLERELSDLSDYFNRNNRLPYLPAWGATREFLGGQT